MKILAFIIVCLIVAGFAAVYLGCNARSSRDFARAEKLFKVGNWLVVAIAAAAVVLGLAVS